jgi:hypothetical protein
MEEIEELQEGIIAGMSLEAVERARIEPDFLQHLRDLIELEGEAEAEVAIADANLRTAQDDMVEVTNRRDQIVELCQHFERGNLQAVDYVDAVDLLRRAESPDTDDVPDERLDSGDQNEGGEGSEETGKKRKRKGKAKTAPKKPRVDREEEDEERDGPSKGAYEMLFTSSFLLMSFADCDRCKSRQMPCIMLKGKTACDGCHKVHTKCSLWPQSKTRLPQKKASRVAEALVELGRAGAVAQRPESQVSSQLAKSTLAPARSFRRRSPTSRRCDAAW